jgi:uncharacterized protein Veg
MPAKSFWLGANQGLWYLIENQYPSVFVVEVAKGKDSAGR